MAALPWSGWQPSRGLGGRLQWNTHPEGILRSHIHSDIEEFKVILDDFGAKNILPDSDLSYDSSKKELRIEFKTEQLYSKLDPTDFTHTSESVVRACILAAEIYRKACYFRRFTGKVPLIKLENLLVNAAGNSIVFRTIGRSLCAVHVIKGVTVGDEETDIARMLSIFLETLIFKSETELSEFTETNTKQGVDAFLSLFINNMRAKDSAHRYSCLRFNYLVDQLRQTAGPDDMPDSWLDVVYLRERLKGTLSRFNSEIITWHSVCRALDEHLSKHIRDVFSTDVLHNFPFRPRLLFAGHGKSKLHVVSRRLMELALCREDFSDAEKDNAAYLDLIEYILLYATVCLETVALVRTLKNTKAVEALSSSTLLQQDSVLINASDYEDNIAAVDLAAIVIMQPKENTDETTAGLSLRQLSLLALFAGGIEADEAITIKRPDVLSNEVFRIFAHTCLFRIPRIEITIEKQFQNILLALRSNEDFGRLESIQEMRTEVAILIQDLKQVRSGFRLSRRRGRADGRDFPPDIRLRSMFHVLQRVREYALPGSALTNSFPSSRGGYSSSWDINGSSIKNLMIPSEGLNSLIRDLTKGKIFGFKLSYLYSGRVMVLWDGGALIACAAALAYTDKMKVSTEVSAGVNGFFSLLSYPLGALLLILIGKLLVVDLSHWVPWHQRVKRLISKMYNGKK